MTRAANLTPLRSRSPAIRSRSSSTASPDSPENCQFSMSPLPLWELRRSLRACCSSAPDCSGSRARCAGNCSPDSVAGWPRGWMTLGGASLRALPSARVRLLTSLPSENSGVIHSQSCTYKFTIDKRPDPYYGCACYLEQTSHTVPTTQAVTLALSISCSLLLLLLQLPSFVFNRLRPLFPKHPGGGWIVCVATLACPACPELPGPRRDRTLRAAANMPNRQP